MAWFAMVFGIMTLLGGIIGYIQAGSTMSLITGSVSGLAIIASAVAYLKGKAFGYYALLALSTLLGGFFIYRLLETGKPMPAVIIISFAAVTLIGLLVKRDQGEPSPPKP